MGNNEFNKRLVIRVGRSHISQAKSIFYNTDINNNLLGYLLNTNLCGHGDLLASNSSGIQELTDVT